MVKDTNERVIVTLSKNTIQKLDELKREYEMSNSQMIQFLIIDYFKKKGLR